MPTVEFRPHTHQWDAIEATRKYPRVWLCGGIRGGKTVALVWWLFLMATKWARGADALLFEPDFNTFNDNFMKVWRLFIPGERRVWNVVHTRNGGTQLVVQGSTIFVRSAMNAQSVMRSEGLTVGYAALDEPARMLQGAQAWTNTVGRCSLPMDGWEHNPILLVGSPRGLYHWTAAAFGCSADHPAHGYQTCYEPDPQNHPGYAIRVCKTEYNQEHLAENYISQAAAAYSPALREQEFGASLIGAEGMIFPEWSPELHVIPDALADEIWAARVKDIFGGGDQGTTAPAASVVMGWTGDAELVVIDEWYLSGRTVIDQGVAMVGLETRWGSTVRTRDLHGRPEIPWYYDPSSAGTIELFRRGFEYCGERYNLYCLPAKYHGSSSTHAGAPTGWSARVDLMRSLMVPRHQVRHPNPKVPAEAGCPRLLIAERCVNLRREMAAYRQKEQQIGRPPREGAVGDDHAIDCVAGAAFTTATTSSIRMSA